MLCAAAAGAVSQKRVTTSNLCVLLVDAVHNKDGAKSDGNGAQQRPKDDGNQQRTSCEKQHIILGNNTLFVDVTTVLPAR